jgi:tRNA pseudouridine(55) synthase
MQTFLVKKYKPIGKTPKQLLNSLEKNSNKKYFHTGNLDIMAEGLMIFVNARFRFLESFFKKLSKTYEFDIIAGFSTDSNDLLGLVTNTSNSKNNLNTSFIQNYTTQVPPKVSYKNLNTPKKLNDFLKGKSLLDLLPKQVKVYKLTKTKSTYILKEDLFKKISKDFKQINGNFRQQQVLDSYNKTKSKIPSKLYVTSYRVKVSGGFYIRALVRDIGTKNNVCTTTYNIKRTKIGWISL